MNTQQAFDISKEFLALKSEFFTIKQVKKLWKLIQFHSELYYEKESPVVSDSEYDELFKKLQELESNFSIEDRQSEKVWSAGKRSTFHKVEHSRPMISLDNTYNEEELRDFDLRIKRILRNNKVHWLTPPVASDTPLDVGEQKIPYTIEFKFDGLWIELIYKDGDLTQAITRWNGTQGEDVTENIKQIKNIPQKIDKSWIFEVRWEVVMPISSFERLNTEAQEKWEKVFSNPRNAASWSLRVLDTSITKKRDLKYFAYDVSSFDEFSKGNYSEMIHNLESLGFEISSYFPHCKWIEEVILNIENIWNIKSGIDFEVDGLVVKLNDISLWKAVGSTEHHPRYAIAYKFPAEIVTTKLESVQHSVGRTGTITPVANLEAVNIAGAVIRRATLHNYDEVAKLWVKIGDIVFLKRAWEVIPKIISVASSPADDGSNRTIKIPKLCPSCKSEVLKDDDKVRYYCPNSYGCPAQMKEKIAFAVWKQWFNIDGFWEKQAQLFLEKWYINNFADIFRLKNYKEEIWELEWFQEKSVNKLLSGIEKVRNTDMVTVLKALGIPGVGKKTAKTLSKVISSLDDQTLWWFWGVVELEELPDIWPEVAESVVNFFKKQEDLVQDLLSELVIDFNKNLSQFSPDRRDGAPSWKWSWKKICITWSFEWYSRDQLAEILEQQGWEFMSSVSKKTDYLLAWEKAGSKLKKAQDLGVNVLTLNDFLG